MNERVNYTENKEKEIAEQQLKKFWLYALKERHPHDCSGGRATITCIMYDVIVKADFIITG